MNHNFQRNSEFIRPTFPLPTILSSNTNTNMNNTNNAAVNNVTSANNNAETTESSSMPVISSSKLPTEEKESADAASIADGNDVNDIPNAVPSTDLASQREHHLPKKRSSRHSHFQAPALHSPTNRTTNARPSSSHHRLTHRASNNVSDESLLELAHMRAVIHDEHHPGPNGNGHHHHHRESTHFTANAMIGNTGENERVTALEQKLIELTGKLDLLMSMQGLHHHTNKHNTHNNNSSNDNKEMLSARQSFKPRMLSTVSPLQNIEKGLSEEPSMINTPVSSRRQLHQREQANMSSSPVNVVPGAHIRTTIVPAHQLNEGHHQRQATIVPVTVPHIASNNNNNTVNNNTSPSNTSAASSSPSATATNATFAAMPADTTNVNSNNNTNNQHQQSPPVSKERAPFKQRDTAEREDADYIIE